MALTVFGKGNIMEMATFEKAQELVESIDGMNDLLDDLNADRWVKIKTPRMEIGLPFDYDVFKDFVSAQLENAKKALSSL